MNDLLRAHVTRVGFDLSLGHTHVAALVELDLAFKNKGRRPHVNVDRSIHGIADMWITAVQGCERRGLVAHHYNDRAAKRAQDRDVFDLRPHYTITPAGRLVLALLKEAGLYEEYARGLVAA